MLLQLTLKSQSPASIHFIQRTQDRMYSLTVNTVIGVVTNVTSFNNPQLYKKLLQKPVYIAILKCSAGIWISHVAMWEDRVVEKFQ